VLHPTGSHPESQARIAVLQQHFPYVECEPAAEEDVLRCHAPELVERVRTTRGWLDADTICTETSFDAALLAAGAAIEATRRGGFALARPPGHHAERVRAMGFCLFDSIAIAARWAQAELGVERVAIVDWDVHHGNGTQGIFYTDPSVYFFSMHQYPWYPGTGSRGETGHSRGLGATLNIPVKASTQAAEQKRMFEAAIEDIATNFRPDLIMISAGFDAHLTDPLGQLKLEDRDYVSMTRTIRQWAAEVCQGRVVSCLEGGYNLDTLGETVRSHVKELASN